MATVIQDRSAPPSIAPSAAGPLPVGTTDLRLPPALAMPAALQTIRFGVRPMPFKFRARRELGETWQVKIATREQIVVTDHPDHVKSLFTAKPHEQHSLTGDSPLRPVLGPGSVLTAIGARHMRQRKLLLPPFHGNAVKRYAEVIQAAIDRELAKWSVGQELSMAPRMQAVTLDVIMSGVFGIDGVPAPDTPEAELRRALRRLLGLAMQPWWSLVDLHNLGRDEPRGVLKRVLDAGDERVYAVIAARRAEGPGERDDVLSLLLEATDEDGQELTDREVRDELMALLLAGHETTANSLAWTFERLVRFPAAYDRLREEARAVGGMGEDGVGREYVEATVHEGMRVRPVIPMVGRVVEVPWQLGEFSVPAGTPVALSIMLLHHREDLYPDPHRFLPERWLGVKPGTYTWIPFGGGTRRCLGAALAMAELRIVLQTIAARVDLEAVDPRPESGRQRNVTTIPHHGGRVRITALR